MEHDRRNVEFFGRIETPQAGRRIPPNQAVGSHYPAGAAAVVENQEVIAIVIKMVDVAPSLQTETSTRLQKPEPEAIKKEQPAPPQSTSEPPKVTTRPSPLLPRTAVNADSLAYTENRVPAGLAGASLFQAPS